MVTILYVLLIWTVATVPLALLAARICSLNRRFDAREARRVAEDQAA